MNAERRKRLREAINNIGQAKAMIDALAGEERKAFENLAEGLRKSERGRKLDATALDLEEAVEDLEVVLWNNDRRSEHERARPYGRPALTRSRRAAPPTLWTGARLPVDEQIASDFRDGVESVTKAMGEIDDAEVSLATALDEVASVFTEDDAEERQRNRDTGSGVPLPEGVAEVHFAAGARAELTGHIAEIRTAAEALRPHLEALRGAVAGFQAAVEKLQS